MDQGYTNPTTFNEPVQKNVNIPFSYTGQAEVKKEEANSDIVLVGKKSEDECISVDVDNKKVYVKRTTTYTINSTVDASNVANCVKLSASNGFTITTNSFGLCQQNGLSISVDPVSIDVQASKTFEQGSVTYEEDDGSKDVQKTVVKTYGPTTETGTVNVTVRSATKAIKSVDTNINNVNDNSSYNNIQQISIDDVLDQSILVIAETTNQDPTLPPNDCTNWVDVSDPYSDFYTYWCRLYKVVLTQQQELKQLPYSVFKDISQSCDDLNHIKHLESINEEEGGDGEGEGDGEGSGEGEQEGDGEQEGEEAPGKVKRTDAVDESAWQTIDESYLIELDPNAVYSTTNQVDAGNDNVRGLCAATCWGVYLLPVKTKSTITLEFSSPMKRGAAKKGQYYIKSPGQESCTNIIHKCPGATGIDVGKYGALCPSEDETLDVKCEQLTPCNEGGAVMIKPWIIHKNLIQANEIITLSGEGTVCTDPDILEMSPQSYVKSEGTITKTATMDVETEFDSRVVIGFTCLLNSYSSSYVFTGNNLEAYVFKPITEYVKMKITIE